MIVHNKQTRPVTLHGTSGLVILLPGQNEIPDADAEILRANIKPLKMEEHDLISFGPTKKVGQGEKASEVGKTLADLEPAAAEAVIAKTNDAKLLEKWRKVEKRDEVRILLINRLEEVKNYKPGEEGAPGETEQE